MKRRQTGAVLAAAAVAACHPKAKPTTAGPKVATLPAKISAAYDPMPLAYPEGTATDFTACRGIALVCVQGGVALAGMGGWALDPSAEGLTSIGCAGTGDGWATRGSDLVRMPVDKSSPWQVTAHLPDGEYHVVDTGSSNPTVWGHVSATGHWVLAHVVGTEGKTLFETTSAISAVAPAGPQTFLVAAGKQLVRIDAKGPRVISTLDDAPDGVAVGGDGSIFVSLPNGIVRMTKGEVNPVAVGIHGPLHMEEDYLYVLVRDQNVVVRLFRK